MAVRDANEAVDEDGRTLRSVDVAAVINVDELQAARQDPRWQAFYQDATDYRAQMLQAGRSS